MTGAASSDVFATALRVNMTNSSVTTRTSFTLNNYGEASYDGDPVSFDCYIERMLEQPEGFDADVTVEYKVFVPDPACDLDTGSQITLPAPVSGTRPIVGVWTVADPTGTIGQVIYIGRSKR